MCAALKHQKHAGNIEFKGWANFMIQVPLLEIFGLMGVACIAGVIDTLAGGGGLLVVPALLGTGMNPVLALSTNKLQSAISEFSATLHFFRKCGVDYQKIIFGLCCTAVGSFMGTVLLLYTPLPWLEKMIPFFLLAVLVYYIISGWQKHPIERHNLTGQHPKFFLCFGTLIGFYNGFLGPGTGSLWAIAIMRILKVKIQQATMYAKPLNLVGNLTALTIFIWTGKIFFTLALLMGCGSFIGGRIGASLVIYKDARSLKSIFLVLMACSVCGTFFKYYA